MLRAKELITSDLDTFSRSNASGEWIRVHAELQEFNSF